jgi:hypothetical protein
MDRCTSLYHQSGIYYYQELPGGLKISSKKLVLVLLALGLLFISSATAFDGRSQFPYSSQTPYATQWCSPQPYTYPCSYPCSYQYTVNCCYPCQNPCQSPFCYPCDNYYPYPWVDGSCPPYNCPGFYQC